MTGRLANYFTRAANPPRTFGALRLVGTTPSDGDPDAGLDSAGFTQTGESVAVLCDATPKHRLALLASPSLFGRHVFHSQLTGL